MLHNDRCVYCNLQESLLRQYERSRFQSHDLLDDSEREEKTENEGSDKSLPQSEILVPERDEAIKTASRDTSTSVDGILDKRGENVVIQNLMDESNTLSRTVNSDVSHYSLFQTGALRRILMLKRIQRFKNTDRTCETLMCLCFGRNKIAFSF